MLSLNSAILLPACSASVQEAAAVMDDRLRQLSPFPDPPSFVGTLRGPLVSDPRPVSPEVTEADTSGAMLSHLIKLMEPLLCAKFLSSNSDLRVDLE